MASILSPHLENAQIALDSALRKLQFSNYHPAEEDIREAIAELLKIEAVAESARVREQIVAVSGSLMARRAANTKLLSLNDKRLTEEAELKRYWANGSVSEKMALSRIGALRSAMGWDSRPEVCKAVLDGWPEPKKGVI